MYEIHGEHFGFMLEPGPNQTDIDKPVVVHLLVRKPGFPNAWQATGQKFDTAALEDLLTQAKRAHHILETEYVKGPKGYRPRRVFF
jgi:hypothetical protein